MRAPAYGYVLFHTSAAAFRAEKLAVAAALPGARLIPTPRNLSSDCGVALRFFVAPTTAPATKPATDPALSNDDAGSTANAVERLLEESQVPYDRIVTGADERG